MQVKGAFIHPAMLTLLQLDAAAPGSITPELAASVCAMGRDLVLELITSNAEQEIAWRQAGGQTLLTGDADEAPVCDGESRHVEQMVDLLRRACSSSGRWRATSRRQARRSTVTVTLWAPAGPRWSCSRSTRSWRDGPSVTSSERRQEPPSSFAASQTGP